MQKRLCRNIFECLEEEDAFKEVIVPKGDYVWTADYHGISCDATAWVHVFAPEETQLYTKAGFRLWSDGTIEDLPLQETKTLEEPKSVETAAGSSTANSINLIDDDDIADSDEEDYDNTVLLRKTYIVFCRRGQKDVLDTK